jgi:hypothetical protein
MGYDVIGVDLMALVKKIDDDLPIRVEGFKSPLDAEVNAARQASLRAHEAALRRVEGLYTVIVWTDRIITAIEIVTFAGTVKVGAVKAFATAVEKGATRAAAVKAATAYVVTQVAAAAGTSAAAGLVPPVLSYAGLNEAEVQAGMALVASIGVLAGLAARPISRRSANRAAGDDRKHRKGRQTPRPDSPDDDGPRWDWNHPLIEGVPDKRRSPQHTFLQQTVADEMRDSGDYARVGMNRPLSEFSGQKHSPDIRPDNIGLTTEGKIDMIEILSPSQNRRVVEAKLRRAWNQLPQHMRGEFDVSDPKDASK